MLLTLFICQVRRAPDLQNQKLADRISLECRDNPRGCPLFVIGQGPPAGGGGFRFAQQALSLQTIPFSPLVF